MLVPTTLAVSQTSAV